MVHADALGWLPQQPAESTRAVVFDPPYAVGSPVRGREDGAAGSVFGPMSFLARTLREITRVLVPGGIVMIYADWRRMPDLADYPTRRSHPYEKPIETYRHVLSRVCRPGDVVLDPFAGSAGSRTVALELGCVWRGCDIDLNYVDETPFDSHTEGQVTCAARVAESASAPLPVAGRR